MTFAFCYFLFYSVREANNLLPQPIKMETYFVELFTITKKKEDMDDVG